VKRIFIPPHHSIRGLNVLTAWKYSFRECPDESTASSDWSWGKISRCLLKWRLVGPNAIWWMQLVRNLPKFQYRGYDFGRIENCSGNKFWIHAFGYIVTMFSDGNRPELCVTIAYYRIGHGFPGNDLAHVQQLIITYFSYQPWLIAANLKKNRRCWNRSCRLQAGS
jgi:hypothetical protein